MKVINITRNNIELIVDLKKTTEEKDNAFLNALWQYVLHSKSITRKIPKCEMCGIYGDFTFEGFGGIKKVGKGMMYILLNDEEVYAVPDTIFHYFYIHGMIPTERFRDAVVNGFNPRDKQYIDKIQGVYCLGNWRENKKIKCRYCGKPYIGTIAYKKGKKRKDVEIYHEKYGYKIFKKDAYFSMCYNCFGITKH